MVGVAALRFAYVRHKRPEAAEDAAGNFQSHVFGIIFNLQLGGKDMYRSAFGTVPDAMSQLRVACRSSGQSRCERKGGVATASVPCVLWWVMPLVHHRAPENQRSPRFETQLDPGQGSESRDACSPRGLRSWKPACTRGRVGAGLPVPGHSAQAARACSLVDAPRTAVMN